uniref:PB1 domain-containing protein n=1 Tax=Oryza barthii TaxID=65489 RepID=A0A0D3EY54_9ORYZ
MALSRRFLNLIVDNRFPGSKSLRCIDLTLQNFFNRSDSKVVVAADASAAISGSMDWIQLPSPMFNFQASSVAHHWEISCFPLRGCEVLCIDQDECCLIFDEDRRNIVTMPDLCHPKGCPISLFVPSTNVYDDDGDGTLFIMERVVKPESPRSSPSHSDQFEAVFYRTPSSVRSVSSTCKPLPLPPFVRDPKFSNTRTTINLYVVVSGGSEICISVEGAGTYCMDTVKHTWRHVGQWTLPFYGNVEYVPELKLWFGLSDKTNHLAAADLSAMDDCFHRPELLGWSSHLVSVGSGRFCIVRFFYTRHFAGYYRDQIIDDPFVVLTGVDVVPDDASGDANGSMGEVQLRMIKYESKLASGAIERESNASILRCLYRRHASCMATASHVRHPTNICSGGGGGACVGGGSRIKILCSFAGHIMPRPSDDALKYIGGETRVLAVPHSIPFSPRADLKKKVEEMFRTEVAAIKYQLVAEDLDVLVSVTCDEDLTHMLDEYDRSEEKRSPSTSPRFRVYIFSPRFRVYIFSSPRFRMHHDNSSGALAEEDVGCKRHDVVAASVPVARRGEGHLVGVVPGLAVSRF